MSLALQYNELEYKIKNYIKVAIKILLITDGELAISNGKLFQ